MTGKLLIVLAIMLACSMSLLGRSMGGDGPRWGRRAQPGLRPAQPGSHLSGHEHRASFSYPTMAARTGPALLISGLAMSTCSTTSL